MTLSLMNLPAATNGHLIRLTYNITRFPLHGKVLLRDRISNTIHQSQITAAQLPSGKANTVTFSHYDLLRGELTYVQTDLSVANDSFEVSAHYALDIPSGKVNWQGPNNRQISTSWLINVVSVPLLKRVKEVRSFVKGFAVGGLIAPDESEFSASLGFRTTMNLAVLDASPLAAVTGSNPSYEILLPPKYGQLFRIPIHLSSLNTVSGFASHLLQEELGVELDPTSQVGESEKGEWTRRVERAVGQSPNSGPMGRVVSRFSHEDVRRGSIIYSPSPDLVPNDILPLRLTSSSSSSMADEFIFKVAAPGVQPALGIAKFNIRTLDGRYYDEKSQNQIISDGSTDPATKRSAGGGDSFRDFTQLVTPHMTKDSLIAVGVIVAGIVTITLLLVIGIRCTCVRKRPTNGTNSTNNGGLNNGNPLGVDPKCNGIGIIDYTPSTTCTLLDAACQSDSECSQTHHHHHHGAVLRPLLMSPLSPRSRHKVGTSHTASESGSWTSSGMRNEGLTPSVPQCRVVPLCSNISTVGSGSESGGYSIGGGGNSMLMCPLLPPAPICDTFSLLPEEIDPPDGYGFTYGSITNSLQPPLDIQTRDHLEEEETHFNDYHQCDGHPSSTLMSGSTSGTLRRNHPGKNQYWV